MYLFWCRQKRNKYFKNILVHIICHEITEENSMDPSYNMY